MRTLGRLVVGLLAIIGAVTVVLLIVGLVALKSTPVGVGASPSPSSSSSAPAPQGGLVADNLSADVVVPFSRLQEQAGQDVRLSDAGGGKIRVNAPFSALGRQFRVETDGDMAVDGADVVVHPSTLRIEGLSALDGVLSTVARQAAGIRVPVPDLPNGMKVTGVSSTAGGVKAHVQGSGIPLPAQ